MKALVDMDMLVYEVAFIVQYKDEEGNIIALDFDNAINVLEEKLEQIQEEIWADEPPTLYLTGNSYLQNKMPGCSREKINFRVYTATTKPYKGNRNQDKPFHYYNMLVYALANYDVKVAWGCEADDLMSIDHTANPEGTVICSRDKDLRMVPGTHFAWPCGKQLGSGPDNIREIDGLRFFYQQMLTGDTADNIPGIFRYGPKKAQALLNHCTSEKEMHEAVAGVYEEKVGEGWREYFKEQAALLWMIRELDEEGQLKHFVMYDAR